MNSIPSMEKQFTKKLVEIIEANFSNEQFGVSELASQMGMSRATLHRKVKATTGKTISQFMNEVRLNAAKQLLTNRSGTVSEVAYLVGFGSSTYFIKCFRDHFGYSPGEVLKENFHPVETSTETTEVKKKKIPWVLKIGIPLVLVFLVFLIVILLNKDVSTLDTPTPSTNNQAALNLYLQGINLMDVYSGSQNSEHFMEAKKKYEEAIMLDSTFGDAYSQLAYIYLSYIPFSEQTNKGYDYIDSGRIYIDKAEHFGVGDVDFMLNMKSVYFQQIQNYEEALRILELRWKNKDKDYSYHYERGNHGFFMRDYSATTEHLIKYLQLKPKRLMPDYNRLLKLTMIFSRAGFQDEAMEFAYRQFELINDSMKYRNWYPRIVYECGNIKETVRFYESAYNNNEFGTTVFNKLLEMYMLTGKTNKGLEILPAYLEYNKKISPGMLPNYLLGYYHQLNNEAGLAEEHFRNEIRRWEYFCEVNNSQESLTNYFTIAACYSMLNNKEGVIENLKKLEQKRSIPYLVSLRLQKSPLFDNYREDPDFIRIKKQIVDKYYREQKTIREFLKEHPVEITFNRENSVKLRQD